MRLYPPLQTDELSGDYNLRKSARAWIFLLISTVIGVALVGSSAIASQFGLLTNKIVLLSFQFGCVVLLLAPAYFFLAALFLRSEARFMPRKTPVSPIDKFIVVLCIALTLLPVLGVLGVAIYAVMTGSVHYKFPRGAVLLINDPLGFWQGVAYWTMGAMTLAYFATVFWRSRYRKIKQQ